MSASRREFLGAASAGAAIAAGWPRTARAANRGANEPLRLALIGCGGQGARDLEGMYNAAKRADVPEVRAIAVCDADTDHGIGVKLKVDARHSGGEACRVFTDHAQLFEVVGEDLDAVIVATPDHQHAPASIAAAERGVAVYCEKPLANSVADCDAILAAAERNGVTFQVGSHERSNPKVRRACELVRGGALGELRKVVLQMPTDGPHHRNVQATLSNTPTVPPPSSLDYAMWLGAAAEDDPPAQWPKMTWPGDLPDWMPEAGPHFWWRFVSTFGGGEITDRGAHILDIAQLATGRDDADEWRPTEVTGFGDVILPNEFYDAHLRYDFRLKFASGPDYVGTTDGPRGVKFVGEKGELFVAVHGGQTSAEPAELLNADVDVDLGRTASHHANFLRSVVGDETPYAPVQAGHRTAVLCHQINAALKAT